MVDVEGTLVGEVVVAFVVWIGMAQADDDVNSNGDAVVFNGISVGDAAIPALFMSVAGLEFDGKLPALGNDARDGSAVATCRVFT